MTDAFDDPLPPSWEQLLTGAHPSFRAASAARAGRALTPRHGRDGWREDDLLDALDLGPLHEDDSMSWGEAVVWTIVAAGVVLVVASRLG